MPTDVQQISKDYRRRARLAYRGDLPKQLTWLEDQFTALFDAGSGEVINIATGEGGSSGYIYRDATPGEQRQGLGLAIDELTAEIEAAAAGTVVTPARSVLIPRVVSAPW